MPNYAFSLDADLTYTTSTHKTLSDPDLKRIIDTMPGLIFVLSTLRS